MSYTVSEAARILGTTPDTLRYMDDYGILEADRSPGGFRVYSDEHLERARQQGYPKKPFNQPPGKLCDCGQDYRLRGQKDCAACREKRLCSCGQYYKAKGREVCGECRKRPWRQERRVKDRTNQLLKMRWNFDHSHRLQA